MIFWFCQSTVHSLIILLSPYQFALCIVGYISTRTPFGIFKLPGWLSTFISGHFNTEVTKARKYQRESIRGLWRWSGVLVPAQVSERGCDRDIVLFITTLHNCQRWGKGTPTLTSRKKGIPFWWSTVWWGGEPISHSSLSWGHSVWGQAWWAFSL